MENLPLPVLRLSDFDDEKNEEAFEKLRKVAREIGSFYLIDHGVDLALCKKLQSLSKQFFSLPQSQKDEIDMVLSPSFRGYSNEGGEYTAGAKDFREQIDLGPDEKEINWDTNSPLWQRLQGTNLYPSQIPELKPVFLEWLRQTQNSSKRLLNAFVKALKLSENFDSLYGEHNYQHCKLLRYPPAFDNEIQGVGPHKDGGLITYVLQDEQSGLQGYINGKWVDVPILEGSFVINIGEFLEMATNGYLKATLHRVNLSKKERFSTAYFLGVQLDKDIPIFKLNDEFAKDAKGVDTDPKNPLLRNVAQNYFKRMIRSHPQVAKVHHSDLIEKFSFA
ncbi:isopenicillin N synthase family oxygenase [Campylobacter sp. LR264d]|uniref:isopenicillin N synthase family dioxygenase n=1 Tax=Campylobacter sp. LR264d TaxID=2593544 RepID=UPI0012386AC9|nr:2-oxoglutarate and iron-dependent oxygenase domain-containing protein [Campylobacter sp. LR264d]KAA6230522.1 isopenicillin N synthase family oxygenase [Campylobacter sp. LR264d]